MALFYSKPHRIHDFRIGCAAAEIASKIVHDLLVGRIGVLVKQLRDHHDEARRAVTALRRPARFERGLQRMRLAVARDAFDGGELRPVGPHGEHQAGEDRLSVQMDGAAAAGALIAAALGPDEPEIVAEDVEQHVVRTHGGFDPMQLKLTKEHMPSIECATTVHAQLPDDIRARHGLPPLEPGVFRDVIIQTWWDKAEVRAKTIERRRAIATPVEDTPAVPEAGGAGGGD